MKEERQKRKYTKRIQKVNKDKAIHVRFPADEYIKLNVIAQNKGQSVCSLTRELWQKEIQNWEQEYGLQGKRL